MEYLGKGDYGFVVSHIYRIASDYARDVVELVTLSPDELHEYVRLIPYVKEHVETLKRPAITIKNGGDCDDKTILILAYAFLSGIPARVVLAGKKATPHKFHHVFPELMVRGDWVAFDATYTWNRKGERMACYDNFKVYEGPK